MEWLVIIVPFPGVLANKGRFRCRNLCESDPGRAAAPFFGQGQVMGASFAVLTLPWQAEQPLPGVLFLDLAYLERNMHLPS